MALRPLSVAASGLAAAALLVSALYPRGAARADEQPVALKVEAPAFEGIDEWINSKPRTWKDLRGQVVVLHFWTFG
jgi:hypothetical protein